MPSQLSASALLAAWEIGAARRPLDRALAVLWAADPAGDDPADLPLVERDRRLLGIHATTFGPFLAGRATCPACGTELEMDLDAQALAASLPDDDEDYPRPLTSRDLAAAVGAKDIAATLRRRLAGPDADTGADTDAEAASRIDGLIAEAATRAQLSIQLNCADCGNGWGEILDVPAFVWAKVEAAAIRGLSDVADLAAAFGWSERDILAMSPARRAAYLVRARPT